MKSTGTKKNSGVGSIDFFCIGFGAIVGVGWAVSINSWMAGSGGPLPAALGYILALVLMIPVALCYCELCSALPVSGGGMSYAFRAFGDNMAFISGWAAFGAFVTIIPWEAIYVVDILSILIPALKGGSPLYTLAGADIYIGHIVIGAAISIILYRINRKGVQSSASLQRILCFLLVGSGILAMVCALFKFDASNFQPIYENISGASHNSFMGGTFSILASVPFFLAGFETIPQGIESAGGEAKSVGKTVVLTVALSCIFYAALLVTLGGAMPWTEFAHYGSPSAALMFKEIYPGAVGTVLYLIILIGAVCGLVTTWNGFMMASSQILMAMARVSIVPNALAKVHPEYGTPTNALKVCLAASVAGPFLGSGLIGSLTTFSAAGYVVSWAITAVCLIQLRKVEPKLKRPYKIAGGLKMAWFAAICMIVLLVLMMIPGQPVFMGSFAIKMFIGWMAFGLVMFVMDYRQRQKYSKLKRASILFASMAAADVDMPVFMDYFQEDYKVLSFVVPKGADYAGRTLRTIGWGRYSNVFVIKVEHKDKINLLPRANSRIASGDRVFILGSQRMINRFVDTQNVGGKYSVKTMKDFMGLGETERQAALTCEEIVVKGTESYTDKMIKETTISSIWHCIVIGIMKGDELTIMPYPDTVLEKGDKLWVVGADYDLEKFIE